MAIETSRDLNSIRENVFSCSIIRFARSINFYGILVYGSATETNYKNLKTHSEELSELFFSKRDLNPLQTCY